MHAIGKRLKEALQLWERGPGEKRDKKAFQMALQPRLLEKERGGQMGATYQTILTYFDGSSTPSLVWPRPAVSAGCF